MYRRELAILLLALAGAVSRLPAQAADDAAPGARLSGHEFAFERRAGVVYAQRDRRALRLDLYLPVCDGPHPVAMVIHGGGWKTGGRSVMDAAVLAQALAREGLAVASISYRLAPGFDHPAQIEDCRSALQYLRAEAATLRLDESRIAAVGASSGGHLAALLATEDDRADLVAADPRARQSTRPTCAVTICAPFDLLPLPGETPSTMQIDLVSELLGLDEVDDVPRKLALLQERGRDASPLYHVSQGDPPMLVIDGQRDWLVVPSQADRMLRALGTQGVRHERFRIPDGGHCEFLMRDTREWCAEPPPFWRATRAFLRRELLGAQQRAP